MRKNVGFAPRVQRRANIYIVLNGKAISTQLIFNSQYFIYIICIFRISILTRWEIRNFNDTGFLERRPYAVHNSKQLHHIHECVPFPVIIEFSKVGIIWNILYISEYLFFVINFKKLYFIGLLNFPNRNIIFYFYL